MKITTIKNIRNLLAAATIVILFFGIQLTPDAHGHFTTLWEAVFVVVLMGILLFISWSDWLYYNQLIAKGAKINYKLFQYIGLIVAVFFFCLISVAMYNGYSKL